MTKENESGNKNLSVFSDVITALALDAAAEVEGIEVLRSKSSGGNSFKRGGASVYFLAGDKVAIDLFVNILNGYAVPTVVAAVQDKIKSEVEGATKYRVHSVNVQVVSVIFN
jgi:uncharacterized alkaline shock family protein YloU